jgi:glutamine synthetase
LLYPAVMAFLEQLARSVRDQEALGLTVDRGVLNQVASLNQQLGQRCAALEEALQQAAPDAHGHLRHCADSLMPLMGQLRETVDALEVLVDDDLWPLPTYQELLFFR